MRAVGSNLLTVGIMVYYSNASRSSDKNHRKTAYDSKQLECRYKLDVFNHLCPSFQLEMKKWQD